MKLSNACTLFFYCSAIGSLDAQASSFSDYFDDQGANNTWEQVQGLPGDWKYELATGTSARPGNYWLNGTTATDTAISPRNLILSTTGLTIHSKFGMYDNPNNTGDQEAGIFFGLNGSGYSATGYMFSIEFQGFSNSTRNYELTIGKANYQNDDQIKTLNISNQGNWFDVTINSYIDHFDVILQSILTTGQVGETLATLSYDITTPVYGRIGAFNDDDGVLSLGFFEASGTAAPVPVPSSFLLIGSGLVALTAVRRNRNPHPSHL